MKTATAQNNFLKHTLFGDQTFILIPGSYAKIVIQRSCIGHIFSISYILI